MSSELLIYYFNDKDLSYEEVMKNCETIPGYIQVVFNSTEAIIVMMRSNIKNKGIGSQLLYYTAIEAFKRNIQIFHLDDMSSQIGKDHNIYVKYGFNYKEQGCPEMTGSTMDILSVKTSPVFPKQGRIFSIRSVKVKD